MNINRGIHLGFVGTLLVAACSGGMTNEEDPQKPTEDVLAQHSPAVLTAIAAPDSGASSLRIEGITLQLNKDLSGILGFKVAKSELKRIQVENGTSAFPLTLDSKEGSLSFNDLGQFPDRQAGDGEFSAIVPVNLERLRAINAEIAQLRNRTVILFNPGSRETIGREQIPTNAIDIEGLQAGKVIQLPRLTEIGPLKALGAVSSALINPQKSLIIRALPVIEDPGRTMNPCNAATANIPLKSWTFGHLMTEMAQTSGFSPSAFVEQWLQHWRFQQIVSATGGAPVLDGVNNNALANIDSLIINPWRQRSGGGALNLSIAPFRLQAIVYRPDLAKSSPYGGGGGNNGGELRFVFGMMEVRDQNNDGDALDGGDTCQPIESAVIFEYGVPLTACSDIKNWANQWVALSGLLQGSPAYNGGLESLTESVVKFGSAPTKPNQNALNQLRTNEIDLTGIWQFREFTLRAGGGPLQQTTVKNNPREHQAAFTSTAATPLPINLNGTSLFLNEFLPNLPLILANQYSVPELSLGVPFRGGASSYNFPTFWDHPALSTASELQGRFNFSLNTCSGCHTGETNTLFYHIRPAGPGAPPTLSNFLLNNPHTATDNRGIVHTFNEMDNRKQALANLANQTCRFTFGVPPFQVLRVPLNSVH